MIYNTLYWIAKIIFSTEVVQLVTALVSQTDKTGLSGDEKKQAVERALIGVWNSAGEKVPPVGSSALNFLIELVVFYLKRKQ